MFVSWNRLAIPLITCINPGNNQEVKASAIQALRGLADGLVNDCDGLPLKWTRYRKPAMKALRYCWFEKIKTSMALRPALIRRECLLCADLFVIA